MQLSDNSANKIKNSYFNDVNNSGFAIETSGNVIVHGTVESDDVSANSGNFAAIDTVAATISDSLTSASLNVLGNADISNNLTVSGRIGINTSVPSCSLDISASDALQVPAGFDDDIADISLNTGMFRYDLSSNKFMGYTNDGWIPFFQSDTDDSGNTVSNTIVNGDAGIAVTTISNEIIRFFDGSSIPLIMDGDGNFGIGGMEDGTIRTLNAKLDIYGNVDISGQTDINNTVIDSDGVVNTNGAIIVNNEGNLYFTEGTYIGDGLKTNVLDGTSNINIGISNEVYIHYDWQDGSYNELIRSLNISNVSSIDTHGEYAIVGDSSNNKAYIYRFKDEWYLESTIVGNTGLFGSSVSIYDSSFAFVGDQSNNLVSVYEYGVWTEQTGSGSKSWKSIASSADGTKLAAVASNDYIYTSTDSGANWTKQNNAGFKYWYSIASSADGTKLAAVVYGGYIYTSTNSGNTWTEHTGAGNKYWASIASSADGTKLATVDAFDGYIYTSTDSGSSWIEQTVPGTAYWWAIASSSDGTKLAACSNPGTIQTSTDGGFNWTEQIGAGSYHWNSITSSADGTKLAAVVKGGYIYTSTDGGVNWTEQTGAGSYDWKSITSSADGTKLAAVVNDGYIYISTDSGVNWTKQTNAGDKAWWSIASSSNGTKLAAVVSGGYIYTFIEEGPIYIQDISGSLVSTYGDYTVTAHGKYWYKYTYNGSSWESNVAGGTYSFSQTDIQSLDLYENNFVTGGSGIAIIYTIIDNTAMYSVELEPSNSSSTFGSSVSISSSYVIVGDPSGSAYIYDLSGSVVATLENSATSVSINEKYAVIGDGNNTVYKYSFDSLTNTWNTTPTIIDAPNNLVSIDDYLLIGDSATAYIYSTVSETPIPHSAIAYGKDKYLTVGSTVETVFSSNDGIHWSSVITDFSYNSVTGIKKVIIDSSNVFFINEIQVWIDGSNVALNADSSINVIDNNVMNIDASGFNDYFSGQSLPVILDKSYTFADLQSVVIYNNIEYASNIEGAIMYFKDEYNNVLYKTIIEGSYNYYRYDVSANGPLIGGTGSGEGIIAPIDFSYNKVKFGINKDVSNITIDVNEIQIWEHIDNSGASVQSLAVTYATNLMSEIQLWAGGENKVSIVETVGASSLNNNNLTDATNDEGGSGLYALDASVNINDIQSIVVYTPPFDSTSGTPPETFTITLYDAPFTDISSIPSSDFIVAQFSFTPDSSFNIFRIDGDASGTYDLSYSDAPSTTNIIASDASGTNDGFYKVQYIPEIPYTINLAAVPTTNISDGISTVTNNDLSDNYALTYNNYITIDLSDVHVSSDLVSTVVYAKNNGLNMNYSTIQMLYDDTIVYQYNIFGADASDNYFRFDGPVIDASDVINEESIYYVVDISNETMIVPWIDIRTNTVPVISYNNYYRPLKSLIYEDSKFVAAGDNCIFYSDNGVSWSGTAFDSINNEYTLIQKDQYFTSLVYGNDKYIAVANNVTDITCFTDPTDPSTFSNISISNASVEGWNSVAYGNDKFVGAGNNQLFCYSDYNVSGVSVDISKNWTSVAYGVDIFVAVSPDGSNNHFISSTNGTVWNDITNIADIDGSWNLVKYTQNIFMAFSNYQYMTSFDGIVWKAPIDISDNDYTDIVAGKDKVVLVTDSGIETIFYSDLTLINNVNLGNNIQNGYNNSVAIGNGAIVDASNMIVLGNVLTLYRDVSNSAAYSSYDTHNFYCNADIQSIIMTSKGIAYPQIEVNYGASNGVSSNIISFGWDYPTLYASVDFGVIFPVGGASDRRLKKHIIDYNSGLDDINKLQVRSYNIIKLDIEKVGQGIFQDLCGNVINYDSSGNFIDNIVGNITNRSHIGLLEDEVRHNFPGLVVTGGPTSLGSVNYEGFVPILINAIQQQQEEISALEAQDASFVVQISALEAQDASFIVQISSLEAQDASFVVQISALEAQDASFVAQISALETQDASFVAQIAALETQDASFVAQISALETQDASFITQISALEAQDASFVAQIAALEAQDASFITQISALETQDASFVVQIAALETQDASFVAQISALEAQDASHNAQISALEAQDASFVAQISALETQDASFVVQISALEAQDASYNAQIATLESKVSTLESQATLHMQYIQNLENQVAVINSTLSSLNP